jgi:hypothetical protein
MELAINPSWVAALKLEDKKHKPFLRVEFSLTLKEATNNPGPSDLLY